MAEQRWRPRPDRRPGRTQRRGPAHRLQPLNPRPRPPQPADRPRTQAVLGVRSVPVRGDQRLHPTAQLHGSQRLHRPSDGHPSRPLYVRGFPCPARPRPTDHADTNRTPAETAVRTATIHPVRRKYLNKVRTPTRNLIWPTAGPRTSANGPRTARTGTQSRCHHPATPALTCGNGVAGVLQGSLPARAPGGLSCRRRRALPDICVHRMPRASGAGGAAGGLDGREQVSARDLRQPEPRSGYRPRTAHLRCRQYPHQGDAPGLWRDHHETQDRRPCEATKGQG
jgi:hypothetical protein